MLRAQHAPPAKYAALLMPCSWPLFRTPYVSNVLSRQPMCMQAVPVGSCVAAGS